MRKEQTFMYNWQRALRDIKESIRLSAKSESDVLKFDSKDWTKWFKSADNFFRRTLGVRGVTLDWIYREEAYPKPGVKYPSIVAELKATLLLEGDHFDEDSQAVGLLVRQEVRRVEERSARHAGFEGPVRRGGLRFGPIQRC
jgi:hypothetical protein